MPIIIPSKNIYGDPKIKIIRNNNIDAVELKHYDAKKDVILNENIFNAKDNAEANAVENSTRYDVDYKSRGNSNGGIQSFSYSSFLPYYSGHLIRIPISQGLETITDLFGGKSDNGEYKISISYGGIMEKGRIICDIDFDYALQVNSQYADYYEMIDPTSFVYQQESSETLDSFRPPLSIEAYPVDSASSKPVVSIEERNETINKSDESTITVYETLVYSGYFLQRVGGTRIFSLQNGVVIGTEEPVQIGEYEKFTPTEAHISINGDKIVLKLDEVVSRFGNGKNVFEVAGNELMQATNIVVDGEHLYRYNDRYAEKIIQQYENGKGTAEINCSIFPILVGALQTDFLTYDETINGIFVSKSGNSLVLNGTALDKTSILVSNPSLKEGRYFLEIPTQSGIGFALVHGEYGTTAVYGDKDVYVDLHDYESVGIFVDIEKGTRLENYIVGDIVSHESLVINWKFRYTDVCQRKRTRRAYFHKPRRDTETVPCRWNECLLRRFDNAKSDCKRNVILIIFSKTLLTNKKSSAKIMV